MIKPIKERPTDRIATERIRAVCLNELRANTSPIVIKIKYINAEEYICD